MKKINYLVFMISMMFLFVFSVKADTIKNISMDIYVDSKGDAHITEIWDAKVSSGTEGYHPYFNMGNSKITDFSVMDDTGETYTYVDKWNVESSFETKKYKNGIYKDGSEVDLCWGISKYGNRKYTLKYTITNFIYNTTDEYQILYWQLIPYEMNPKPDNVYIKIHSDKRYADNLDVWGYGNYDGTAYVYDGYIEVQSPEEGLNTNDYMVVLVKFPANYFETTNSVNKSWEEIYNMAQDGATAYVDNSQKWYHKLFTFLIYVFEIFIFVGIPILIAIFAKEAGNKIKNKKYPKDVLSFRELPFKDDFGKAYLVADEYKLMKQKTDYLGAIILKWIKDDNIHVTTEEKGIFKNKETKIEFIKDPIDAKELELWEMMKIAAKDNILEKNEFKRSCSNHYSKVLGWFDKVETYEYNKLKEDKKYIDNVMTKGLFGNEKQVVGATELLNEKAMHMAGLKKFFKEFDNMSDKQAIEVKMWREYLIYAQIFGMAKEVAKEFKNLYPDVITDDMYSNVVLIHDFSYASVSAATTARSRAQSYSSGGGGFSSGGGGGGSFGGGGGGGGFR